MQSKVVTDTIDLLSINMKTKTIWTNTQNKIMSTATLMELWADEVTNIWIKSYGINIPQELHYNYQSCD